MESNTIKGDQQNHQTHLSPLEDPYKLPARLNINATGKQYRESLAKLSQSDTKKVQWIAPSVDIWGDVRLAGEVSIWFQSVLRGDVNFIEIGTRSNIQDGTIIHVSNQHPCRIGKEVTVGHRALLHACTIEDLVLVGMGATVLTGAVVGTGSVIAAGAVVKENETIPPFTLVAGVPARKIRSLDPDETNLAHQNWAQKYVQLANAYKEKYGF